MEVDTKTEHRPGTIRRERWTFTEVESDPAGTFTMQCVRCAGGCLDDAGREFDCGEYHSSGSPRGKAIQEFIEYGFKQIGGKWYCPHCAKKK